MSPSRGPLAAMVGWLMVGLAVGHAQVPAPQPYSATEATGEHVLALWQFNAGQETEDNSGRGHTLKLRGNAGFVPEGRFGSCLESFPARTEDNQAGGGMAANSPQLTPDGAFTLELWLKPKPEMSAAKQSFLVDKKYFHYARDLPQANTDYCLYLEHRSGAGYTITASLGFGTDSVWASSQTVQLEAGTWYQLAYAYDGAGTSRFFVDGKAVGKAVHPGRGAVTAGRNPLVIGDRVGSSYVGCAAFLDEVRLCRGLLPAYAGTLEIGTLGSRTVFRRLEENARVSVSVDNDTSFPLTDITLDATLNGVVRRENGGTLAPGASWHIDVPVDTRLRPGEYPLQLVVTSGPPDRGQTAEANLTVRLVARPAPDRMPVVMWGHGDPEQLKEIGFTHQLAYLVDYGRVWKAGEPTEAMAPAAVANNAATLNRYLAEGIEACAYLYPGRWVGTNKELGQYQRVDRAGKTYPRENISASHPDMQAYAYNVGASVARTFGHFPAFTAALVHSEIRDGTALSFHDFEQEAARRSLGFDIPPEAVSKNGVSYSALPGFPAQRVIPDDHPILRFYSWFWKDGDGWNPLHTRLHEGLKSTGRTDLWTFFDPAVRAPSVWGSGGGVDVISQWTYSYPDPIKIGEATDELFAMADGHPGQQVMKMTQIIWYRSGTAPTLPEDEAARAQWEKDIPDAKFITIAPDHLREAFWSELSRPVRGIMYHGWGSLVPVTQGGYRFTNPETAGVLQELIRTVVRPLGPTLLQVPDRPNDVALLTSFSSQVFAGRGTSGWSNSWEARLHEIAQWAALQPRILFDEHVVRDRLAGVKVLFLPACDVLTKSVADAVLGFQRRGGIVVGDEFLCPAISPDILVPSCGGRGEARETKAEMQAAAAQLRQELDAFYTRYADTSDPDVIPRVRSWGTADYLFALNDKRTYGAYVGHHRKVMEKGLPAEAVLSLNRATGQVYDLVAGQQIATETKAGRLLIPATFGGGGGHLFLVTERPIRQLTCNGPNQIARGERAEFKVTIGDDQGNPVDAVIPVQLTVLDADGATAEGSGFYAAAGGKLTVALDLAPNDSPGTWTVVARELASNREARSAFTLR